MCTGRTSIMASAIPMIYMLARLFQDDDGSGAAAAGGIFGGLCGTVVGLALAGLLLMGIFRKAGKPTWAAFVPLYNSIVLLDIVGRPMWWIILFFIPFVNLIIGILVCIDLAKSFGKDTLFGIGLIIPFVNFILILMLSYGDAQ